MPQSFFSIVDRCQFYIQGASVLLQHCKCVPILYSVCLSVYSALQIGANFIFRVPQCFFSIADRCQFYIQCASVLLQHCKCVPILYSVCLSVYSALQIGAHFIFRVPQCFSSIADRCQFYIQGASVLLQHCR